VLKTIRRSASLFRAPERRHGEPASNFALQHELAL
jgi:hypothetical protein